MKIPLRFQVTEYDCGTASLLNAFSYLFEREEIPVELIKAIFRYTLDAKDKFGNIGYSGTSGKAIKNLIRWINKYAKSKNFGVTCTILKKDEITIENMIKCLNNHGCIFIHCYFIDGHYVIITKINKKYVYMFDPYYLGKDYNSKEVKIILNKPFSYNRKVSLKRFLSKTKRDFALGELEKRECVLINRK